MPNVFDVAKFILEQHGETTTMKLQKLVYYSQAWSLAWSGEPIFDEKVKGWRDGPVVGSLHFEHQGRRKIAAAGLSKGDPGVLSDWQRKAIQSVLGFYGEYTPEQLSDMTHSETPWLASRVFLSTEDKGNEEITRESMRSFYGERAGLPGSPSSPELLRHLAEGIEDAKAGRIVSLGSFAHHLED